jgi:hypothetical protein
MVGFFLAAVSTTSLTTKKDKMPVHTRSMTKNLADEKARVLLGYKDLISMDSFKTPDEKIKEFIQLLREGVSVDTALLFAVKSKVIFS